MCEHDERPIGRMLIGLDLTVEGNYSLTIMAWRAGGDRVDESESYSGLTLPEAIVAIDATSSRYYADPF